MCQNTLYRASPAYARYTENYAEQGQGYAGVPRGQKNAKPQAGHAQDVLPILRVINNDRTVFYWPLKQC